MRNEAYRVTPTSCPNAMIAAAVCSYYTHLFPVGKSLIPKYGSRQNRNCVQNITILDSKINPYKLTNLVRGQLEHSI